MRYEAIRQQIINAHPEHEHLVRNWDVRCVGELRQRFPDAFPPELGQGPLRAELTDAGYWNVFPDKEK